MSIMANATIAHTKNTANYHLEGDAMVSFSLMKERRSQMSKIPLITKKSKNSHNSISTTKNMKGRKL